MIYIKISRYFKNRCTQFAMDSVDTHLTHYRARGQSNRDKIIDDIIVGKTGEIGINQYLSQLGECSKPDFKIYTGRRKSFSADLAFSNPQGGHLIHVKAQSALSASKYGVSCLFQYSEQGFGHMDRIFKSFEEHEVLAMCGVEGDVVTLYGIWRISDLFKHNLFEEPKLQWFKNTKRAVYLSSIVKSGIENLMLSSLAV